MSNLNRAFWVARYRDRKDIYEYAGPDWSQLPRKGLCEVILSCPNGMSGVLGHSSQDISDRAFQFKIARAFVNGRRQTDAQVIGVLLDPEGRCVCYAWEYDTQRLVQFEDNLFSFFYGGGVMATPSFDAILGRPF